MAWRLPAVIVVMCAAVSLGATARADVANPAWPQHCPLKLGLLVDQSSSMEPQFGEVRQATKNVVDALRDKRSEVTVIGFASDAKVIRAAVDVSDEAARHELKKDIDELDTVSFFGGGTNWESALALAEPLTLDVAVMVTDGQPNVSGSSSPDPQGSLLAAVAVADRMKTAGTRLVTVGINLADPESVANLKRITGPIEGSDYYANDTASLLHQLYEIVANACGVPIAALPTPEAPAFPLVKVLLGMLAGLLLLVLLGYLLYRARGGRTQSATAGPQAGPRPVPSKIADPTISHEDIRARMERAEPPAQPSTERPRPPAGRSRSLDFLAKPDAHRQNDP
jgi:von Willebrand factor type A domain-containing protein